MLLASCSGPVQETRELSVRFEGEGTVTVQPGGTEHESDFTRSFARGTPLLLTAEAEQDDFLGWRGACDGTEPCELVLDEDEAVVAAFGLAADAFVTATASGPGWIASPDGRLACPGACRAGARAGERLTLRALAETGARFDAWGGACAGAAGATCELTVVADAAVSARFSAASGPALGPTASGCAAAPVGGACTATVSLLSHAAPFRGLELGYEVGGLSLDGVVPTGALAGDCLAAAGPTGIVVACASETAASGAVLELRLRRAAAGPTQIEIRDAVVVAAGGDRTPVAGGALVVRGGP